MRALLTISRFVALEARRTGMLWLFAGAAAAGLGLTSFLSQLALTEGGALQAGVLAALFRVCAVFLTATFVITSMVRESNDKGVELLLSMPISRTAYYLGKLLGFAACGCALAAAFSLLILAWSPPLAVGAWFVSLALETALMAAVSLFFVVTLAQVVPALAASASLYLLSRVIGAIQAVSSGPLLDDRAYLQKAAAWSIDAVALILPPLDRATQTVWLIYGAPAAMEFLSIAGALLTYGLLIAAAGLFDFHRRNL